MPEEGSTENLLSIIQNVDVDKVGDVLKEFEKYEKILDKVSGIVMRLNRIGVLPAALRILGQKTGMKDIDKPLPQPSQLSIEAISPTHLMMYKEMNKVPETAMAEMYKQALMSNQATKKKEDADNKD